MVIALVAMFFGVDPIELLQNVTTTNVPTTSSTAPVEHSAVEEEQRQFVSVVLADTEDAWTGIFSQQATDLREAQARAVHWAVAVGLWKAQTPQSAPFTARRITKFTSIWTFYRELRHRFGAPGDFAQAYVIAHEVGHHVQNLLGVMSKVRKRASTRRRRCQRPVGSGWSSRPIVLPVCGPTTPTRRNTFSRPATWRKG